MVRAQPAYPATPALSAEDWKALREACGPVAPRPAEADAAADREIAEATKTLEKNPNDVPALQKRARAYTKKRQHEPALADFTKAIQLKPADATLHVLRGQAYHNLRRYEDALRDYDEAIRLEPNMSAARNGRANTNRALKRYEAALTDFDELIRSNPKFVAGYFNRALVLIDLNKPDDAMRDLNAGDRPRQGLCRRLRPARPAAREVRRARPGHRRLPRRARRALQVRQQRLGAQHRAHPPRRPRRRGAVEPSLRNWPESRARRACAARRIGALAAP